jgi:hypothetical protein
VRNEEALCSRLFLSLERFTETVALAKACAPRLAKGNAHSFALTNGEMLVAWMLAKNLSREVNNHAGSYCFRRAPRN